MERQAYKAYMEGFAFIHNGPRQTMEEAAAFALGVYDRGSENPMPKTFEKFTRILAAFIKGA